ncbi:MAG: Glyoxalase/bleomycin resistance protein/dioxygenase [Candidatus Eremiobacteraeota bacterium]|nr:Glyoxalase/bleomycin resistance protein/dioxygenase [Candidatus Eremiobacteraeota bacterium]
MRSMHLSYESVAPVMYVERVEPTRDFFRDRLGFKQTAVVADGDELGFAMLEKDGVVVMIQSHASLIEDVGHDAARAVNETISGRGAVGLYISVSDVDLVVPTLADADVIVPLRKTFYGMHEITVREPGGHSVTFASRLPQ